MIKIWNQKCISLFVRNVSQENHHHFFRWTICSIQSCKFHDQFTNYNQKVKWWWKLKLPEIVHITSTTMTINHRKRERKKNLPITAINQFNTIKQMVDIDIYLSMIIEADKLITDWFGPNGNNNKNTQILTRRHKHTQTDTT